MLCLQKVPRSCPVGKGHSSSPARCLPTPPPLSCLTTGRGPGTHPYQEIEPTQPVPSLSPCVGMSFHFRLNVRSFVPLKRLCHMALGQPHCCICLPLGADRVLPPWHERVSSSWQGDPLSLGDGPPLLPLISLSLLGVSKASTQCLTAMFSPWRLHYRGTIHSRI